MVIAVVMAGGKGTRLKMDCEKPLLELAGKPMIDYVLSSLSKTNHIEKVYIATSPHTPLTKQYLLNRNYQIIDTPGEGYVEDLGFILKYFEEKNPKNILLTVSSDVPCIKAETFDLLVNEYKKLETEAMNVAVPEKIFKKYGIKPTIVFDGMVPAGVNILSSLNKIQNEELLILEKIELALNINNSDDIKIFNKYYGVKNGRKETD